MTSSDPRKRTERLRCQKEKNWTSEEITILVDTAEVSKTTKGLLFEMTKEEESIVKTIAHPGMRLSTLTAILGPVMWVGRRVGWINDVPKYIEEIQDQ